MHFHINPARSTLQTEFCAIAIVMLMFIKSEFMAFEEKHQVFQQSPINLST